MKVAICDDMEGCRAALKNYIEFYFKDRQLELELFVFDNGQAVLDADESFDLLLLDIEMPGPSGLEVARQVLDKNKRAVIFVVTGFQQYLDEAMDLRVWRYLEKPVNQHRLYDGLDRAVQFMNENDVSFRSSEDGVIILPKPEIVFIEVTGKKVMVCTREKLYTVIERMSYFKTLLTGSYFAVPHNSFIVNLNFVKTYKRSRFILNIAGRSYAVPIAPKRQPSMKRKFMTFIGETYQHDGDDG